jgi:3-keto-disaccharide hydrolase
MASVLKLQPSITFVLRILGPVALLPSLWSGAVTAAAEQRLDVPMIADRWQLIGRAEFKEHKGAAAIVITAGAAKLNGVTFRNGTIEFDLDPAGMGAGVGFRMRDEEPKPGLYPEMEMLYVRPSTNCATAPDCVQYAPVTNGVLLWDMFPQYQAPAPVRQQEWNHVKVVVAGQRMNVFLNGARSPALAIPRLEGDVQQGVLALLGPGAFKNVAVIPNAVEGLAPGPGADSTAADPRFVRHWQIAPFSKLPEGGEPRVTDMPGPSTSWRPLAAERSALVNISRVYGKPVAPPARAVTWLKTRISSTRTQSKTVSIGWIREVWVFVNGARVFADKNLYQPPSARKAPDGRLSLQNGTFVLPLNAGDNEVAVAIANNFYGWGLILRLDDLDGLQLARE